MSDLLVPEPLLLGEVGRALEVGHHRVPVVEENLGVGAGFGGLGAGKVQGQSPEGRGVRMVRGSNYVGNMAWAHVAGLAVEGPEGLLVLPGVVEAPCPGLGAPATAPPRGVGGHGGAAGGRHARLLRLATPGEGAVQCNPPHCDPLTSNPPSSPQGKGFALS